MTAPAVIELAFLNENTLGHSSYLPRFAAEFERRPELGIRSHHLDVTPLPPILQRRADFSIRGLRRFGLDFQIARWRDIASGHARQQLDDLRRHHRIDGVIVNTQSVGLRLADLSAALPLIVCLDATFQQLRRSRWFAMNRVAGWLTPLTLATLLRQERLLYASSRRLLAWSAPARTSLLDEYHCPPTQIEILPPSLDLSRLRPQRGPPKTTPQVLFVGGDFHRKGGPLLLEAFRQQLAGRCELHVVTQSPIAPEPGVFVHRNIRMEGSEWFERWSQADVFVFPSRLETFGIVLLEAMAFAVPVVASRVGVAAELLGEGPDARGIVLDHPKPNSLAAAVVQILDNPAAAESRAARGRQLLDRDFDLGRNSERLALLVADVIRSA